VLHFLFTFHTQILLFLTLFSTRWSSSKYARKRQKRKHSVRKDWHVLVLWIQKSKLELNPGIYSVYIPLVFIKKNSTYIPSICFISMQCSVVQYMYSLLYIVHTCLCLYSIVLFSSISKCAYVDVTLY
jgi:hypothetical protein